MIEIFGKYYYIDIEAINEKCKTGKTLKDENGTDNPEINIFQYELLKLCIERIFAEFDDNDDNLDPFGEKQLTVSFKIAFNTLIKNKILIEDYE